MAHASLFLEDARRLLLNVRRLFRPQERYEQDMLQTLVQVEMSIFQRASDQDFFFGRLALLK